MRKIKAFLAKFSLPLTPENANSLFEIALFVMCVSAAIVLVIVAVIYLLICLK